MKRVRLLVNYGKHGYGSIVELKDDELELVGSGNYEEVAEEVEVSDKDTSDCSELQAEVTRLQDELKIVTNIRDLNHETFTNLLTDLAKAKTKADFEAVYKKYKGGDTNEN